MDIQSVINSINWSTPSWDLFVIIIFIAGISLYTFGLGRDRVFLLLISSYISLALFGKSYLIFETFGFQIDSLFLNNISVFLGGILLLFFIFSNSDFISLINHDAGGLWLKTMVISFLQIGLVISIIVSFLTVEEANALSVFIKFLFVGNQVQLFWLLSPFAVILLFKGKL